MKPGELWKGVAHTDLVDAQPAIDRVQALAARGMLLSDMVEQTGLNDRTVRGFLNGYISVTGGRRIVRKCIPATLQRILAIEYVKGWTGEDFRPDLLRGLRESKGLSRGSLAAACGICAETIQYWETGRSRPLYKEKIDAVLSALGAGWEDVSGDAVGQDDVCAMVISDGILADDDDYTPDYPCHVCGGTFRSRMTLARHPHPKKKVSA